jgi:TolB-like protein
MMAGLVMLLVGAGLYFLSWRRNRAVGPSEMQSLAVLPLRNLGGGSEDEYLSDGITEELITKLTKLKNLRVVSHSVVMRFKNSPKDSAEIGRELGVEAVLDA